MGEQRGATRRSFHLKFVLDTNYDYGYVPYVSIPLLLPTLAARFAWIIASMRYERATGTPSDRRFIPLLDAILTHLNRLNRQFAALCARAQAGTLRASPRRRPGKPLVQRLTWPRPPRVLPTGYLWMAKLTPWMRGGGDEIYNLVLVDPQMAALIEAAPQVKRMLRSILWALCLRSREMPEILRLPPRVRAPRRRAPRAAVPVPARPVPARPPLPRPGYRPSCNWPKGVLTPRPRSRGKLRYGAKPPLPD